MSVFPPNIDGTVHTRSRTRADLAKLLRKVLRAQIVRLEAAHERARLAALAHLRCHLDWL